MDIGIITLNGHCNYGNRLQNYALSKAIDKLDYNAKTIWFDNFKYNKNKYLYYNLKNIVKYLINWNDFRNLQNMEADKCFANCIREYKISKFSDLNIKIKYTNYSFVNTEVIQEFFIVGSDQVWNPNFWSNIKEYKNAYFLKFADKNKRIAYAASFGINQLPKEYEESFKEGLNGIPHISVREHAGAAIVKKLTGRDVPVLVDPTLLLSDEEWRSIEMRPDWYRDEKYILTYFLGDVPQVLDELAKKHNYKIYNLMDADNLNLYTSRVEEFLWLIDHAELVCTDSFHACVFSIIFNTPFVVVKRQQKGVADMTSRLDTLLGLFGYQNRLIDFVKITIKADELLHMDFGKVKAIQKREIARSTEFLKKAMKME